jgi:chromosome segregation ATPase
MASRDSSVLREKFKLTQDALAQYKQDLASRDEKVFSLQSKLVETENSLADIRTKYIDLERSNASLRERFVATELEKEGLRVRLANTSGELSDLRKKFVALLNKISSVFKTADDLPAGSGDPGKGTVNVELIPQEGREDAQSAP